MDIALTAQVRGQLQTLPIATRQCHERLPQPEVTEANVGEPLERVNIGSSHRQQEGLDELAVGIFDESLRPFRDRVKHE